MPKPSHVTVLLNATKEVHAVVTCPYCGLIGTVDSDQYFGRVSIQCECGYHETHDLSKEELSKA